MKSNPTSPGSKNNPLIFGDESYEIIGAGIEVHRQLGHGFVESVYQESLEIELSRRQIPFIPQIQFPVHYRGVQLKSEFRPDFVCHEKIILEIKAISIVSNREISQVLNYLRVTGMKLGLLFNFGSTGRLEHHRVVL